MSAIVDLEGIHNFRALEPYPLTGGGSIREGMIFRAGALELMTDADFAYLTERARLARIMDLRHPDEAATGREPHALTERVIPLSIFPEDQRQDAVIAELNGLYGPGPTPQRYAHYLGIGGPRFAQAFRILADERSYPILIHCTAGKDRTGVIIGLLMDLLGAADEDIANEYGLSDASIPRLLTYLESIGRQPEGTQEEVYARLSTPPERMAGFIEIVRAEHGGAEQYLLGQGVTPDELRRVRELMTSR